MKLKLINLWIPLLLFTLWAQGYAGELSRKDSLVADFSYLVEALEVTHPDPYSGFGGKVFFHKEVFDLKNDLKQNDYSNVAFAEKISAFLSKLQDGHTHLFSPEDANKNEDGYLPVEIRIIPDGAVLSIVPAEHGNLLGCRIKGINHVSIDSILQIISRLNPCENIYGCYSRLKWNINRSDFLKKLCTGVKDSVSIQVETPEGKMINAYIPLVDQHTLTHNPVERLTSWDKIPSDNYMSYTFLDEEKQAMLFKLTHVMARENFEYELKNNAQQGYNQLQWFYQWIIRKEMPADTIQALAGIPSMSDTFNKMLLEMKDHNSRALIIDLRNNQGGYTPIILATLYQLYGDKFLQKDMGIRFVRLLSPLYLEKTNSTLDAFNSQRGKNYRLGEYLFYNENEDAPNDIKTQRENFIGNCMSCTPDELRKQNGRPVYSPQKVYVVTNEGSFSASFHFAFYLWKMGAIVVGVPPQQAPNTFMEMTPLKLPYTGIEGSISNTMQVFLPAQDKRARIFWPDIMLTPEEYRKYEFDTHTEIRYLTDKISQE